MYKIDKNVPIPIGPKAIRRYPLREMEIGDSFFVPDEDMPRGKNVIHSAISVYAARSKDGWKFKSRSVDGGVRVWRVE